MTTETLPTNPHFGGPGLDALTSAHRHAIALIQRRAIDVSLTTRDYVSVNYAGHVHELSVNITPYAYTVPGNYRSVWQRRVILPPSRHEDDSVEQLHEISAYLEYLRRTKRGAA